jgi:hypothetical protein
MKMHGITHIKKYAVFVNIAELNDTYQSTCLKWKPVATGLALRYSDGEVAFTYSLRS